MKKQNKNEKVVIKAGDLEVYLGQQGVSLSNKVFPVKVNYWLARIFDRFRQEHKIYVKKRNEIIEQYKDDNPEKKLPQGQIKIKDDKISCFNKDLEELMNLEISIDIDKISIEEKDMPQLSIKEMELLLPILDIKGLS